MKITDGIVHVPVRELIELVLRSGSITASFVSRARAVEGTRAHKKIQDAMEGNYEKEVKLVHEHEAQGITFVVEGRADGIITDLVAVTIDEIKSTRANLADIDEDYNPLHWAQAKCYAYFYAFDHKLKDMSVRLTYYNLDTKQTKHILKVYEYHELQAFFAGLVEKYAVWIRFYMDWVEERTGYLKALTFPFGGYRQGQRELAVNVYQSITREQNLYVNAPTGIGKTISTLFPTLKAMGEKEVGKIFYLTAKTITRTVAEKSIAMMAEQGLRVKSLTLTAKDKICFCDERNCHPDFCRYAEGHFDRVDEAIYDALMHTDIFTREVVELYAMRHRVCPFELALDLATYADVVICDYNYIFDPTVALKRFIDQKDFVFLVDEAHNLVERARSMYSESISEREIASVKQSIKKQYPTVAKALVPIEEYLLKIQHESIQLIGQMVSKEAPLNLYNYCRRFIGECDAKLQKGAMHKLPQDLLELYFRLHNFNKIYEFFDEHYITYAEQSDGDVVLKLFCIDPSNVISQIIAGCKSVIFFSATLMPITYFKYMLGGEEDRAITLGSPFESKQALKLVTTDVSTRYQHRERSYEKISKYIASLVSNMLGNYMIFFPSYKYMQDVYAHFSSHYKNYKSILQRSQMDEGEREVFLEQFKNNPEETHIGFCVLGGIFSEGIDLTYDRLIGVAIVGVGLPQIGLEKNLIKNHFDELEKDGYHYAYTYPGMNKVLQAMGRLIRTQDDRGVILLIDDRFTSPLYSELMPEEYEDRKKISFKDANILLKQFWDGMDYK